MAIQKAKIDNTPFNVIQSSDILTKDDFDKLIPLTKELQETFVKSQVFRTRTEMEVSVLNDIKFPTPQSKYWQSVREQNNMFEQLVFLSYEYREKLIDIEELENKTEMDKYEAMRNDIKIEKYKFQLKQMEKVAKDRIRELKDWSEIKEREAQKMSEYDLANVGNHQLISYTKRWINQFIQIGGSGSPSERQNLIGQLKSGLKVCNDNNIDILSEYPKEIIKKLKEL